MQIKDALEFVRKESFGDFEAELYMIEASDQVPLAITRLAPQSGGKGVPVVLVHGSYCKRNFWVSSKGIGLGAALALEGFEVWIPELRGHGNSPKTDAYRTFSADDHICKDLPAIQKAVLGRTGVPAFWIGHSFGGLHLTGALSLGVLSQDAIRGFVTLGSQIAYGDDYLKIPPIAWGMQQLLRVLGVFHAPRFGLGPEVEPAAEVIEVINWKKRGGRWMAKDGRLFEDGLPDISIPNLSFAGKADKGDPPEGCQLIFDALGSKDKTFIVLARENGFCEDYGHVEMVVSKQAKKEVWPLIASWCKERSAL